MDNIEMGNYDYMTYDEYIKRVRFERDMKLSLLTIISTMIAIGYIF